MRKCSNLIFNFVKREDGPTAVEYAVMIAGVLVICVTALAIIGANATSFFGAAGSGAGTPAAVAPQDQ